MHPIQLKYSHAVPTDFVVGLVGIMLIACQIMWDTCFQSGIGLAIWLDMAYSIRVFKANS